MKCQGEGMTKFTGIIAIEHIKDIIEGMSKLVFEPSIKIRKDGFYFEEVDKTVSMVTSVFIPKSIFTEYKYSKDMEIYFNGPVIFNNIKKMHGDISLGTDGSIITLHEMERNRTYEVRLVSKSGEDYSDKIEKALSYTAEKTIELKLDDFRTAINDGMAIFDNKEYKPCTIILNRSGLVVKTEAGDGFNKFIQRIKSDKIENEIRAEFPVHQIKMGLDLMMGDKINIELKTDHPIKLSTKLLDMKSTVVIAPIIAG